MNAWLVAIVLLAVAGLPGTTEAVQDWTYIGEQLATDLRSVNATLPPAWATKLTFNETCSWTELQCSEEEGITSITLHGFNVTGSLSEAWPTTYANLTSLHLGHNGFQGTLPPAWANFSRLTSLELMDNRLTGTLPGPWSGMRNMVVMDLSSNALRGGLPDAWASLANLTNVSLQVNQLTGSILESWASLTSLQLLNLDNNTDMCGAVPSWQQGSGTLSVTYVYTNVNTSCPNATLQNTTNSTLQNATNSTLQDTTNSTLQNTTNSTLQNATSAPPPSPSPPAPYVLTYWEQTLLDIKHNVWNISDADEAMKDWNAGNTPACERWPYIICDDNGTLVSLSNPVVRLSGSEASDNVIPDLLGALISLTSLDFANNQGFIGTLPASYSNLKNLVELSFDNNFMSGPLPEEWSTLGALTLLDLSKNTFTGTIPSSWTAMKSLNIFKLETNRLRGPLLPLQSPGLDEMTLDGNLFTGTLPSAWSVLGQLTVLSMRDNMVTGTLPASWSALTSLGSAWMSGNELSGTIPPSWSAMASLSMLGLMGNDQMCGSVPAFLAANQEEIATETKPQVLIRDTDIGQTCDLAPSGMSSGAVAGVVIACLVAAAIIGAVAYYYCYRDSGGSGRNRSPFLSRFMGTGHHPRHTGQYQEFQDDIELRKF